MKILVLSTLAFSLINFRGRLLKSLVDAGHDVVGCAPDYDEDIETQLAAMGIRFCLTPMEKTGTNPVQDLKTIHMYHRLMKAEQPDAVIAYTQKPIIYGGMAARWFGKARFHALMSGLGYVYSPEADHRKLLRRIVSILYRTGVAKADTIFGFNSDDQRMMKAEGIITDRHNFVQVPGSGVPIDHYFSQPLPDGPPTFLMVARLMKDKGVGEFIEAARIVRQKRPDARFQLLGRLETDNPTSYPVDRLAEHVSSGLIEHLPQTTDVRPAMGGAHVLVLPSFYREGLPRTLLEGLSVGRPLITTDMPGCREPVRPGKNGYLVPPRDAPALAAAMLKIIERPEQLWQMSQASRKLAEDVYDVDRVNRLLISTMKLGGDQPVKGNLPMEPSLSAVGH